MHLPGAIAYRTIDLANHDGGTVAKEDFTRTQPIRAKIDETAHRALRPDRTRNGEFVEAILRGQDIAASRQMRLERYQRCRCGLRLHRQHDDLVFALYFIRH